MRLPEDVALEVASTLIKMARINGIKKFQELHVDAACKIVNCHLIYSTIQWYKYMKGDTYQ